MASDPHLNLDIIDFEVLHFLASTGSMRAAGEKLQLSQPAITQRIKRIEERFGVALIERAGRGVRLTPAGKLLTEHGTKITAEFKRAVKKITAMRDGKSGLLRLVSFPSASATIVPEMMRIMHDNWRGISFKYREAEPPDALEMLRSGQVDCALIFNYQNQVEIPSGTEFTPLWQEQLYLIVPDSDPRSLPEGTVCLSDFATSEWIAGCANCRGNLLAAASEHNFVPEIVQETDNIPAMVAMAAAGGAVALVPALALQGMRTLPAGVRALPLAPARYRTIGLVASRGEQTNPAAQLVAQLVKKIDPLSWGLQPL